MTMHPHSPVSRRPLKIAVLGSTYARFHADSQVPWLRESVNRLAQRGHDVTVIAPSFEGLPSHEIDGIPVRRFRYAPWRIESLTHDQGAPNKLHNPFYNLLAIPYILAGIVSVAVWTMRERYDVIHVHWPFPHGLFAVIPQRSLRGKSHCHLPRRGTGARAQETLDSQGARLAPEKVGRAVVATVRTRRPRSRRFPR